MDKQTYLKLCELSKDLDKFRREQPREGADISEVYTLAGQRLVAKATQNYIDEMLREYVHANLAKDFNYES